MNDFKFNRREILKLAPAGLAALAQPRNLTQRVQPGEIAVRVTAGSNRFAEQAPIGWQNAGGSGLETITINPAKTFQEILGFGAALTDAACYMLNQLSPPAREEVFHDLFHPSQMGFSVCRICIGSSDYATKAYSFDEGEPDPEMKRFSIDHDRDYILPVLKQARSVNPDLFLLGSPWSPPGWMKANNSMLGAAFVNDISRHTRNTFRNSFSPMRKPVCRLTL